MKEIVLRLDLHDDDKAKQKALKTVSTLFGVDSMAMEMKEKKMRVVGTVDPVTVVRKLRKHWPTTHIISVGPTKESEEEEKKKEEGGGGGEEHPKKEDEEKKDEAPNTEQLVMAYKPYSPQLTTYYYHLHTIDDNPNLCLIS